MYARCARRTHASFSSQRLALRTQKTSASLGLKWTCRRCLETAAGPSSQSSAPAPAPAKVGTQTDGTTDAEAYEPSEMVDWLFNIPDAQISTSSKLKPQLKPNPTPTLEPMPPPRPAPVEEETEKEPEPEQDFLGETTTDTIAGPASPLPFPEQLMSASNGGGSIHVRLMDTRARKMVDFFAVVREVERRFGRVRDFRIQKDQDTPGAYMSIIYINFENSSSVDQILQGGFQSLQVALPAAPSAPLPSVLNNGTPLSEVKRYLSRQSYEADSAVSTSRSNVCECIIRISDFPLQTAFQRLKYSKNHQIPMHHRFIEWGGFYPHRFVTEGPVRLRENISTVTSEARHSAGVNNWEDLIVREAKEEMELALNASRVELFRSKHAASGIEMKDGQLVFKDPEPEPTLVRQPSVEVADTHALEIEATARTRVTAEEMPEDAVHVGEDPLVNAEALASSQTAEPVLPPEPEYVEPLSAQEREDFRKIFRSMSGSKPQADKFESTLTVVEETASEPVMESKASFSPSEVATHTQARVDELEASTTSAAEDALNRRERRAQKKQQDQETTKSSTFAKRLLGWMGR